MTFFPKHSSVRCAVFASAVAALSLAAAPLAAQSTGAKPPAPPAKSGMEGMDHSKMDHGKMDHGKMSGGKAGAAEQHEGMSGWKELDAYHMLMMATWHPAKSNGDVAPIKAKATDMVAAAKLLAASTPPKSCATPQLKDAANNLVPQTQGVADLVARQAADGTIKDALKLLHDKFDVLEEGCKPMKH